MASTVISPSTTLLQTRTSTITSTFLLSLTKISLPNHGRTLSSSLRSKSIPFTPRSRRASNGVNCYASSPAILPSALLFDCDGVLVDTEKDGHRISFNDTFAEKELGVTWDVDLYGELLKIGGGKERMTAYFNKTGWPEKAPKTEQERKDFIASLHRRKTKLFMALIEKKLLPLRPGVAKLIDQAMAKGVKVAVCSTSNEKAVSAIVSFLLGPDRAEKIDIFAGDVVPHKKPDPAIYLLAANTLNVQPSSLFQGTNQSIREVSRLLLQFNNKEMYQQLVTRSFHPHLTGTYSWWMEQSTQGTRRLQLVQLLQIQLDGYYTNWLKSNFLCLRQQDLEQKWWQWK